MGLQATGGGESLTTTVTGTTIYLGLSGTAASDYTIDVFVDETLRICAELPFYEVANNTRPPGSLISAN